MAKKTHPDIVQIANLKIPKDNLEDELNESIAKAKEILKIDVTPTYNTYTSAYGYPLRQPRIQYNEEEFEAFKKEYKAWIHYVSELLKQSFDIPNNEYQRDFVNTGQTLFISGNEDWVKEYKTEIRKKSEYLESLISTLKFIPCIAEIDEQKQTSIAKEPSNKIFIVHGHDEAKRLNVELLIEKLGYEPIVLFKQPSSGATIIEKLEKAISEAAFAIVLYTKCDEGKATGEKELKPRARQNVVFEHGLLCGVLGRKKVVALLEEGVEWPGDLNGIVYIGIDPAGAWQLKLVKEMRAGGLKVDMNKL